MFVNHWQLLCASTFLETVDQSRIYKNYAYIHAQETAGTGKDLVVTHLVGDMTEIMITGNDMGYVPPLIAGGEVMMVITIGVTDSVPSSCSVELEPAYPSSTSSQLTLKRIMNFGN